MQFASDNTSGAAPEIMAALVAANAGFAPSYGKDDGMARVEALVRETFEAPEAKVFLVATGTIANALSLSLICPPWGAIYCHEAAHINVDECGAVEQTIGGGKMAPIAGAGGKITPAALSARLAATPQGDVHSTQHGALSLTNLTEAGTLYTSSELAELSAIAHAHGIKVHLDGARFANAVAASNCTAAEMSWKAGVDVLSLGATKNGCLGVEAVVVFDPALAWELELRRKRAGQLFSKHRFLSAQFEAYLRGGLWLRLAAQANQMAQHLSAAIAAVPGVELLHQTQGNMVFARLPRAAHAKAMSAGARYFLAPHDATLEGPPQELITGRFVCSWSTTLADISALSTSIQRH